MSRGPQRRLPAQRQPARRRLEGLADVRLGPDEGEAALWEPHVSEFNITGRAMKGWVLVDPEGVESNDQLKGWVQRAGKFVGTLPAKEK